MTGAAFKRHVLADLVKAGNNFEILAKAMGMHPDTLRKRLDDPDLLTRHDIARMSGYVSRETIMMICPWWREEKKT